MLSIGMFGTILFIPLFLQGVIGSSATASGTALTPMMISMIFSSMASGQFISRTGRYRLAALGGLGLMCCGMFLLSTMGIETDYLTLVRNMIVMGIGLGACMPIFTLVVQNAVPFGQLGTGTAVTQFARSIGGTLGAAVFGSLLANRYGPAFHAALSPRVLAAVPAERLAQLENPQTLLDPRAAGALQQSFAQLGPQGPDLLGQVMEAIRVGLASALHEMFLLGAGIVLVAWVSIIFLREIPLRRTNQAAPRSGGEADGQPLSLGEVASDGPPPRPRDEPVLVERHPNGRG
jgi:MFS family permease